MLISNQHIITPGPLKLKLLEVENNFDTRDTYMLYFLYYNLFIIINKRKVLNSERNSENPTPHLLGYWPSRKFSI